MMSQAAPWVSSTVLVALYVLSLMQCVTASNKLLVLFTVNTRTSLSGNH